jgi:hypothetical protein
MMLVLMNIAILQPENVLLQWENVTIITYVHKTPVSMAIVYSMNLQTNAMTTMLAQLIAVALLPAVFIPILTVTITMHVPKTTVTHLVDVSIVRLTVMMIMLVQMMIAMLLSDVLTPTTAAATETHVLMILVTKKLVVYTRNTIVMMVTNVLLISATNKLDATMRMLFAMITLV